MAELTIPKSHLNSAKKNRSTLKSQDRMWHVLSLPMLFFLTIPLLALFINVTPSSMFENLKESQVVQAVSLSLGTAFVATLLTMLFGTPVAYCLSRSSNRVFRIVDTLVDLPTVLPPAVAGVALLMAFGRRGLFGEWLGANGITIPFTQMAVIIAQMFVAGPLYIKAATVGFKGVDEEIKQAAALDGANNLQIFSYIVAPLAKTAILSGSVTTWARALGEFGATIIFAGNFPGRTQTMPLAIYIGFEIDMSVALTLSVILIGFSFLTLVLVKGVMRTS